VSHHAQAEAFRIFGERKLRPNCSSVVGTTIGWLRTGWSDLLPSVPVRPARRITNGM
jgi:hypothetical protein